MTGRLNATGQLLPAMIVFEHRLSASRRRRVHSISQPEVFAQEIENERRKCLRRIS